MIVSYNALIITLYHIQHDTDIMIAIMELTIIE